MVVATRRRAKEDASKVGGMMEMMFQESGCVTAILDFLPLVDFYHFGLCNTKLYKICKDDPRLRFCQTYCKSWWSWFDRLEDQWYADDHPFKKMRRGGLEDDFAKLFARTEVHMIESVVAWCGGWKAFLRARHDGAKPALPPSTTGSLSVRAGDDNKIHRLCKPVVMFDIHRDNQWQWSALHPLCNDDLRSMAGRDDDDEHNEGVFYPYASGTKSLGDPTCAGTAHPWNHGRRPNRYLLSTDWDDTRTYKFSVSIVSPNYAETYVESFEIVPADICNDKELSWHHGNKRYNSWVARDQSFRECSSLLMNGGVFRYYKGGQREDFGPRPSRSNNDSDDDSDDDDSVYQNATSPRLRFQYYRDTKTKRFHVNMEVWWDTLHFYNMWVHPPAAGSTQTMFTGRRSKKRRL